MTRFRTGRLLSTVAALVALASVTACASPDRGTAAAIFRPNSLSNRTVARLPGKAFCTNRKTANCVIAKAPGRADRGLQAINGRAHALMGGNNGGIRNSGDALTHGVFLERLRSCARQYPVIGYAPPERVLAVGLHESGLRPLAIHDNTTGLSLYPETPEQAVAVASSLRRAGHRIDAGVMQVSHANWAAYGLTVGTVFDIRANICAGARILGEAYLIDRRAACRYNTGRPDCANGYAESIDRTVDGLRRAPPPPGAGAPPSAPAAPAD
jgi:Transglycosylase SLT domain